MVRSGGVDEMGSVEKYVDKFGIINADVPRNRTCVLFIDKR